MKKTFLLFTFLHLCLSFLTAQSSPEKDNFNPKKYGKMVEIDMKGLFSYGPGSNFIYRTKHESGNFVFVDRTRYWRFALSIGGSGERIRPDVANITVRSNQSHGFFFSPSIGHETMFHLGRFNLFYAFGLSTYYQYQDLTATSKSPCIANSVGLSVFGAGGMRYYFHERFSVSVETTPLGISGYFKKTKYYQYYDSITGSSSGLNFSTKDMGFNIGQNWLSSLGFTYHF
jgi:hypothetical protein